MQRHFIRLTREVEMRYVRRLLYNAKRSQICPSHCAHGGLNTFYSYESSSLELSQAPVSFHNVHSDPSYLSTRVVQRESGFSLEIETATRKRIKQTTLAYVLQHPDVALKVHDPGARTPGNILSHKPHLRTNTF